MLLSMISVYIYLPATHLTLGMHLVTVNLVQANQELVGIVEFITDGIGKFVKSRQDSDPRKISVVVETTRKLFPAHEQFHLGGPDPTNVIFDYRGRNLRCCYCFSYRHLSSQCRQPKPSLFASPHYKVDEVKVVITKGQKLHGGGASTSRGHPRSHPDTVQGPRRTGKEILTAAEDEVTASKRKMNRPRQRTGRQDTVSDTPAGVLTNSVPTGIDADRAPDTVTPREDTSQEDIPSSPHSIGEIDTTHRRETAPAPFLRAEGWSPHPTGRNLGKGSASGMVGDCSHSPSDCLPARGASHPGASSETEPGQDNTISGVEEFFRGFQSNRSPGNFASSSRHLSVALFDGAPRKRLRSEFPITASTPKIAEGTDDILRPTPRNF